MSDFVAERRHQDVRFPPIQSPCGFVAEVRRTSRWSESPGSSEVTLKSNCMKEHVHSDYDLAFNEVLSQKLVSKDTLREVTKKSIVKLLQTLLSGSRVTKVQGFINVSTVEGDDDLCLELNEQFQMKNNPYICPNITDCNEGLKFKNNRSNFVRSPTSEKYLCHDNVDIMDFGKYPDNYPSRIDLPMEASSGGIMDTGDYLPPSSEFNGGKVLNELSVPRRRRDSEGSVKTNSSEEESGYSSSNGRESVSDEGGDEIEDAIVYDNSHPEPTESYEERTEPYQDVKSEDTDHEEERGLVIDLSGPVANGEQVFTTERFDIGQKNHNKPRLWSLLNAKPDREERVELEQDARQQMDGDEGISLSLNSSIVDESSNDCALDIPMDLSVDKQMQSGITEWKDEDKQTQDPTTYGEFACRRCPSKLPNINSYKEHALQVHQLHACVTCFKDFSSKNNLKRHVRIHTGSRPYKCGQCEKSFARRDDLKGHTLRHDYNKPFRCSICKKGYTDRSCVKNHMLKEHCSRLMQICPECGESFDRVEVFLEHKKSHPCLQQFACDTCQFIGTNHLMALKHKLLHSFKLFSCKPCNAYFADPFGYTKHIRKHKKTPEFTCYVCCFCDTILPTYDQFVRHEYSHAQGKLHECNVCKKQFKSKTSMLEHSYVHSDPMATVTLGTVAKDQVNLKEMDCNEHNFSSSPSPDHCKRPSSKLQVCQFLTTIPSTDMVDKIENNQDSSQTNLMDFSQKPHPSGVSRSEEFFGIDEAESTPVVHDISSPTMLSLSKPCVPRNGCAAIETRVEEQEKSSHSCGSGISHTNSSNDEKFKVVWQSPGYHKNVPVAEIENMSEEYGKTCGQYHKMQRERSTSETVEIGEKRRQHIDRKDIRYHPFSRDFASKFVAARLKQSKLLKEIGNAQTGILTKNESIASAVTSLSQAFLKARVSRHLETSGNIVVQKPFVDHDKLSQDTKSNTVIGLSGKPCLARNSVDRFVTDDETKSNCSVVVKGELMEDYNVLPTSTSEPQTPSEMMGGQQQQQPRKSSSEDARHNCAICQISFESFSQLENHSVNEHKRYLCEHCMRGFTARPNRDRHLRYHTGERPYKCDLCPSAFMRGDDLKNHRTSRHRAETINCDKCLAPFAYQKDLDRHKRNSKCFL